MTLQNTEHILNRRDALKTLIIGLAACPTLAQNGGPQVGSPLGRAVENRRDQLFDDGWRFYRGDSPGAEKPEFADAEWRALDLPHDWSIESLPACPDEENGLGTVWGESPVPIRVGPFDRELSQGGRSTGWVVGGVGWYRKRFHFTVLPVDSRVEIVFDGVYMNSDVWLNGTHLGNHPYGYTQFAFDLTPHLRREGENVLGVRVRNEGRNSRWYSGSGICRHVRLRVTGEHRFPLGGVFITTPDVSRDKATVNIAAKIENRGTQDRNVTVRIRLFDSTNGGAGSREFNQPLTAGAITEAQQSFEIANPRLWSADNPQLYRAEIDLLSGGAETDRFVTNFGIRRIEVNAEKGLRINGEEVKLKGGCLHHDNGLLGSAAIDRAEERRVELMKRYGFNAIRTAHNPPSPEFLDACDRLGVMVIDEFFDQWEQQKNPADYHLYFNDWWKRDVESTVLRDRNHPSVILWSIGNEITEHRTPRGVEIERQLSNCVRQLDATRPITASVTFVGGAVFEPAFHALDVAGCNYMTSSLWNLDREHELQPKRVIAGTEAYPNMAFESWQLVMKHSWIIGDFVWTGMDHLGEAAIGSASLSMAPRGGSAPGVGSGMSPVGFPWFNNFAGDVDLIGEAKPQLYFRRVVWGASKLEMAVQRPLPVGRIERISDWGWSDELRSWTWPGFEGRTLNVRVYSNGDQVRLLLNGKEIDTKPVSEETKLRAEFQVPYASGELKAVALLKGEQIAEIAFRTAGKPARLRLGADRLKVRRSFNDLSYVTLDVLDQSGQSIPDAAIPVHFIVTGAGELAASGTANPKDVYSFRNPRPRTFHGKALVIVRPSGVFGNILVRAESQGLTAANITIQTV
jgi:beta-galactosidase